MRMLGYDVFANKLMAVVLSGLFCAASGAAYAVLFGYVGSGFAAIQYSILPLLWVLVGGAATSPVASGVAAGSEASGAAQPVTQSRASERAWARVEYDCAPHAGWILPVNLRACRG